MLNLRLLGGFELVDGIDILNLSASAQKLVSFLALHDRPLRRVYVAGNLWADSRDEQSMGSLRSTLWRIGKCSNAIVETFGNQLKLERRLTVDFRNVSDLARRVAIDQARPRPEDLAIIASAEDLLPGLYDDWVVMERERLLQLRIRALAKLSAAFLSEGRYQLALEAGLAAVECEPLRESSHRAVVAAHLADGNIAQAWQRYAAYRSLLQRDLGLKPSPAMDRMVAHLPSELRCTPSVDRPPPTT